MVLLAAWTVFLDRNSALLRYQILLIRRSPRGSTKPALNSLRKLDFCRLERIVPCSGQHPGKTDAGCYKNPQRGASATRINAQSLLLYARQAHPNRFVISHVPKFFPRICARFAEIAGICDNGALVQQGPAFS